MGYRSDLAMALTSDAALLLRGLCEHSSELSELISDADECYNWTPEEIQGGHTTKFRWGYIKWYDHYVEVEQMETFLSSIDDEEYHIIRLGEETADIDERGAFFESDMHVTRGICL